MKNESKSEAKQFYKSLFVIVAPIALQNLLSSLVNSLDVLMLGFVGQTALAAVSLANQVQFLMMLFFIGLASGGTVAAGLFAFVVAIGIINRIASRTGTANHIRLYECMVIAGGIIFNLVYLFSKSLPTGYFGLGLYGLFTGMYVGLQAMALAEVIKTIPILAMRIKLVEGMPYIVVSIAIGKIIGSLFGLCYK